MTEPDADAASQAEFRLAEKAVKAVMQEGAAEAAALREAVVRRNVPLDLQAPESQSHLDHVHAARVSAARGLVVVRRRTGKPIPAEILELAGAGWE